MFFELFWTWLQNQLATYVGENTRRLAESIEPAAVTLVTIYVMVWGYLSLTGRLQEHVWEGVKRILMIIVILGLGLRLWTYNTLIVDTTYNGPTRLAAQLVGSQSPVQTISSIWEHGGKIAQDFSIRGGVLNGDFGFYLAAFAVYVFVGAICAYSMFLMALSRIGLSLVLVLGPIFIVLLLFESTKRFFEAWVAMLANYALITVLAVLVSALLLGFVESFAIRTSQVGNELGTPDALYLILASVIACLVMRQVPSIASGLASGIALSTFGAFGATLNWGLGTSKRTAYEVLRGSIDGFRREPIGRWDSFRRMAGNLGASGVRRLAGLATSPPHFTGGTVVPREVVMPEAQSKK